MSNADAVMRRPSRIEIIAGAGLPAYLFAFGVLVLILSHLRDVFSWIVTIWATVLLLSFWNRYQAAKIARARVEFGLALWLSACPVMIESTFRHHLRYAWAYSVLYMLALIVTAVRYVKYFYLGWDSH